MGAFNSKKGSQLGPGLPSLRARWRRPVSALALKPHFDKSKKEGETMFRWTLFVSLCFGLHAQERYQLEIKPLDLKVDKDQFFLSGLNQIESDGERFYLCGPQNTEIVAIDARGNLLERIGGPGGHPSEFGSQGVLAISVQSNRIWGIDMGATRARLFEGGTYKTSFRLKSFNISRVTPAANSFAFSDGLVVIPTNEKKEHLAAIYTHEGDLVDHIGEPMDFNQMVHPKILGMNDTHWLRHGEGWISVHKFFPLINFYDANFGVVDQVQLETAWISRQLDLIMESDPGERYGMPTPVFSDVKVFRGDLYLISQGILHQVDLKTRQLKSVTTFSSTEPEFEGLDVPHLNLYFFAFLNNGTFILGHPALLWNHDLWTTSLPFLEQPQN